MPSAWRQACPDLDQWPGIWHYDEPDIPIGQQIVEVFTPFILHLLDVGLARKTVSRHRDNLWQIGGELIRLRHQDPELAKLDVRQAIQHLVQYDSAPLIYPASANRNRIRWTALAES